MIRSWDSWAGGASLPEDLLVEETQPRDSPAPGQQRLEAPLSSQTQAWEGPQPGENRRGQNQMDTLARETLEGMVVFQHPFIPTVAGAVKLSRGKSRANADRVGG